MSQYSHSNQALYRRLNNINADDYQLLDEELYKHNSGRTLYIRKDMMADFVQVFQPTTIEGIQLITGLKALGAYGNFAADSAAHIPALHSKNIAGYQVTFKVVNTEVFISDIRFAGEQKVTGIYENRKHGSGKWGVAYKVDAISAHHLGVNGNMPDFKDTSKNISEMIEAFNPSDQIQKVNLFYVAPDVHVGGIHFRKAKTGVKADNYKHTCTLLAKHLEDAQLRNHPVKVMVHSDAVHLFDKALSEMPDYKDFSSQEVLFAAPTEAPLDALDKMLARNMKVHPKGVIINEWDINSYRAYNKMGSIGAKLQQFDSANQDLAAGMAGMNSANTFKTIGNMFTGYGTSSGASTIMTLTGVATDSGDLTLTGATLAVGGAWFAKNRIRMLGLGCCDNADINPHFNPHLSETEIEGIIKNKVGQVQATSQSFLGAYTMIWTGIKRALGSMS